MDRQPSLGGTELLKQISILDAIYWLSNAWDEVTELTIQKCFKKSGFAVDFSKIDQNESVCASDEIEIGSNTLGIEQQHQDVMDDDDVPLSALKMSYEIFGCSFNDLLQIDNQLHTCDTEIINWDKPVCDILTQINEENSDDSEDEIEEMDDAQGSVMQNAPSLTQANEMVFQLKSYALQHGHASIMYHLSKLEDEFSSLVASKSKQSKISDFFNRTT
ncbi:uncharacterized protein LOC132756591 [Ruditapes philippinarum]|uniref:uncharacterized protein LOC132756591 n=1 Tax=Ruditapes philippinarum TaxID=129788 RepID=UPI00295BFA2D|nr:uncharacterized protein LOC132756591 [Ruditapes philippinarum]